MEHENNIVHSDITDPNYESREQELDAKEAGTRLDLLLRLGLLLGAGILVLAGVIYRSIFG